MHENTMIIVRLDIAIVLCAWSPCMDMPEGSVAISYIHYSKSVCQMGMHAAMAIYIDIRSIQQSWPCMQCMPIFIYMHGYSYVYS